MSTAQILSQRLGRPERLARPFLGLAMGGLALAFLEHYAPAFFRTNNLINVLDQAATLVVMAVGMTLVMIGGGIDLSLPFNAALSAVLGAMFMRATHSALGGPLVMIVAATLIGGFNGVAVAYLKMIPFVVTLAMMSVTNGAAVWLTNSISIADIPDAFVNPFFARYFGLPLSVYMAAAVVLASWLLTARAVYGRRLYAVGINPRAARIARIPEARVIATSYVLAGFISGISAVMLTGRLASASSNLASPTLMLDVVSACVVGGVSIYGGAGTIGGAVFGALFMTLLNNALNAGEVSVYSNQVIRGGVIVAFIALERIRGRR